MPRFCKVVIAVVLLAVNSSGLAQTNEASGSRDTEQLKIAALEALMSAPPEKSLPIVTKVLRGGGSEELKERALFIVSQIDLPEARALLLETARSSNEDLRHEAIRMIGIGGDTSALSELYTGADPETKEAVLEAYLISGDRDAVYLIASEAQDPEEFEAAVEALGAMGATEQLRALRNRTDMAESLIEAYAIAGDTESLRELAQDGSNPERQAEAIRGLGIVGEENGETLVAIYGSSDSPRVKEAALEGLLISGDDEAVLELFRRSTDDEEKTQLLETLVMMDSEAVWEVIDATLENGQ